MTNNPTAARDKLAALVLITCLKTTFETFAALTRDQHRDVCEMNSSAVESRDLVSRSQYSTLTQTKTDMKY